MDEATLLRIVEKDAEIARLRSAIIKICDRAHKPMVGCVSESFNIAIWEAKALLNETMPRPPYARAASASGLGEGESGL